MKNNNSEESKTNLAANISKTALIFTAGAVAGAVAALLLAPKSGADTRKMIGDKAVDMKDSITGTITNGMGRVSGKVSEKVEELLNKAKASAV